MAAILRRREICIVLFAVVSLILVFNYYVGEGVGQGVIQSWESTLISIVTVSAAFATVFAAGTLVMHNVAQIRRRREGWWGSIILLASFAIMFLSSYVDPAIYDMLTTTLWKELEMAVLVYVGFYSYTIMFRASLGVRSPEVALLLICTLFGLLKNAPVGEVIWSGFPLIGNWLNYIPGLGSNNGLLIGIAIGEVALYVRTLMGYEIAYMGEV
jgi:hypothetical protein